MLRRLSTSGALETCLRIALAVAGVTAVTLAVWSAYKYKWVITPYHAVIILVGIAGVFFACILSNLFADMQGWLQDQGRRAHRAIAVVLALASSILASLGVAQRWHWWAWTTAIVWIMLIWWWADRWIETKVVRRDRWLNHREEIDHMLRLVQEKLNKSYEGTLPSVNVMVPCSDTELEVYACTTEMARTGRAGVVLKKGEGCVGRLWARNGDYACAVLRGADDHKKYGLDGDALVLNQHIRCVLTIAIRHERGQQQQLLGYLNIDSSQDCAAERWTLGLPADDETEAEITVDMKNFLLQSMYWVADEMASFGTTT